MIVTAESMRQALREIAQICGRHDDSSLGEIVEAVRDLLPVHKGGKYVDPLVLEICTRLGCGGAAIMTVLDMWEMQLKEGDRLRASIRNLRQSMNGAFQPGTEIEQQSAEVQKLREAVEQMRAAVASIDAKLKGDPADSEMVGLVRAIVDEDDKARQIPFLDDAVRSILRDLQGAKRVTLTLAEVIESANEEIEAKHAQWQAAAGEGAKERALRQILEAGLRALQIELEAYAAGGEDYAWMLARVRALTLTELPDVVLPTAPAISDSDDMAVLYGCADDPSWGLDKENKT